MSMRKKSSWVILAEACAVVLPSGILWGSDSARREDAKAHYNREVAHAKKREWDAAIEEFTNGL